MSDPNVEAQLQELRAAFAQKLSMRVRDIREAVMRAQRDDSAEAWAEARSHAHRLAGVAGSFGFPEVGERAADLEEALLEERADWTRVTSALVRLEREADC